MIMQGHYMSKTTTTTTTTTTNETMRVIVKARIHFKERNQRTNRLNEQIDKPIPSRPEGNK